MVEKITAKLVLLGDGRVGKTSLRRQYMGEGFSKTHLMTIGADFTVNKTRIDDKYQVNLQIWDLAGQSKFKSVRSKFMRGTQAVLMLFDLTNPTSFHNITDWLEEVLKANDQSNIPIVLIGNKNDLADDRQVSQEQVDQFIDEINEERPSLHIVDYYETSAKTGYNVDAAFETIARASAHSLS